MHSTEPRPSGEPLATGGAAILLRPHHLLCIQKFAGHGYSAAFTAHMSAIVSALAANPRAEITLTQGCDTLCEMCPNALQGVCRSLEKVAFMDSAVCAHCNLAYGERVAWETAAGTARERIFETEQFQVICGCCQWFALCSGKEGTHA